MNKHILFALAGYPSSGKDEFSKIATSVLLKEDKAVGFYKFADGITKTISIFTGLSMEYLEKLRQDCVRKENESLKVNIFSNDNLSYTYRDLAIRIGEGFRLMFHQDIWADTLINKLKAQLDSNILPDYVFVTDLRRPNEHELLECFCNANGIEYILIYIDRLEAYKKLLAKYEKEEYFPEPEKYHSFLREKCNVLLFNDGTLDDYYLNIFNYLDMDQYGN